jgi:hypothetical protein
LIISQHNHEGSLATVANHHSEQRCATSAIRQQLNNRHEARNRQHNVPSIMTALMGCFAADFFHLKK